MKKLVYLIILTFLASNLIAQNKISKLHSKQKLDCTTCHECETPTKTNPCLALCPRDKSQPANYKVENAPKVFNINNIKGEKDIYGSVKFSHKMHAEMTEMSGGCVTCHHYNPPGKIVKCSFCHEVDRNKRPINMPDLKSAYHRQCMDCHQTWEKESKCENCHALNDKYISATSKKAVVGSSKKVERPITKVYKTKGCEKGQVVSFQHNDHIELFGFECKDCHQNETCESCHSQKPNFKRAKNEFKHSNCVSCHDTEDKNKCVKCHSDKESKPFNHFAKTGFDITKYHSKVSCNSCHTKKGSYSGLKSQCQNCHNWTGDNFDHAITGLKLSDDHIDLDCSDCHENNNYKKPTCSNCHDEADGFVVPKKLPGKKVK